MWRCFRPDGEKSSDSISLWQARRNRERRRCTISWKNIQTSPWATSRKSISSMTTLPSPPTEARRFAYVDRGFYAQQLERLFRFFPREQVKVVKFEAFKDKQRETLASIFSFLGVEPLRSVRSKDRNIVPYERAMNWEERVFLYNLFAQDIANVERMLGWDCSDWKL